jgi:hypothetical protein
MIALGEKLIQKKMFQLATNRIFIVLKLVNILLSIEALALGY